MNDKALRKSIEINVPTLLIGHTGTGKTTMVRELAKEYGKTLHRFSITGDTTVDDFVGKFNLVDGNTKWTDGILLNAMKNGDWIVVDEINAANSDILFVLHSLLDDDRFITLAQHDNSIVRPHEDFRIFATMNPTEDYAGTKELNTALLNRFAVVLHVDYAPNEDEIVIDQTGVSKQTATKLVIVAKALRAKDIIISTRDLVNIGKLVKSGFKVVDAIQISFISKVNAYDAEVATQTISHALKVEVLMKKAEVNSFDVRVISDRLNQVIHESEIRREEIARRVRNVEQKEQDFRTDTARIDKELSAKYEKKFKSIKEDVRKELHEEFMQDIVNQFVKGK